MTVAIGLELSTDTDMAAIAVAERAGGKYLADIAFYGSPDEAVAQCSRLYSELEDNCGTFADPVPCAGILDGLRDAGVWLHLMEATDVAAASWQYTTEIRNRRVRLGKHPALKEAMRAALPRPLVLRFAFERKRVTADMSPLNACAFALWGYRRNEEVSEPGVWVVDEVPGRARPAGRAEWGELAERDSAVDSARVRQDGGHD
jgi:hypothetical protein